MQKEFSALRSDIDTAKEDLRNDSQRPRLTFLEEYYDVLDSFLIDVLKSLAELCADETPHPPDQEEDIKNGAYSELQRVRRLRSAIHSQALPIELYYLLQDIKVDLSIDHDIGLDPGSKPERKFLISDVRERFRILEKIVFYEIWDENIKNPKLINIPRSELRRPLSYSLIAHECFHTKDELVTEVVNKFEQLDIGIEEDHREEAAIDILSLNYMGPVYAERLVQIPSKIGEHDSDSYPDLEVRLGYSIRYIEWISEPNGDDSADSSENQTKVTQQAIHDKLESNVYQVLSDRRTDDSHVFTQDEFRALQEDLQDIFAREDIPTYISERENLRKYLGMPEAKINLLTDKLDKFLLDNDGDEIALPIKPILLLNLLLLMSDYTEKDVRDIILLSFKKWYVTNRTRKKIT